MIDPDCCPHPETIDAGDGYELCIVCGEDLSPSRLTTMDKKTAARALSVSLGEVEEGMKRANTDDPLLGAAYAAASCFAVAINPPAARHQWNLRWAKRWVEEHQETPP